MRGCGVLIVVSEPSPIAALEGSSGRVRGCDVEMLASNSLRYFRLFLGSLLILSFFSTNGFGDPGILRLAI